MKPYRIFVRRDVSQEILFSDVADALMAAREEVLILAKLECGDGDNPTPYIDDEDELLVVDVDGALVMAYKNGSFVDVSTVPPYELPTPWFIGVDVVKDGRSIFGTSLDPWDLEKNDLLRGSAAEVATAWVKENTDYSIVHRFQGDMREETVYHIMPSEPSPAPHF